MEKSEANAFIRYVGLNNYKEDNVINNELNDYNLPSARYESDDLSRFVDLPMHLLMLGVVKAAMLKIRNENSKQTC